MARPAWLTRRAARRFVTDRSGAGIVDARASVRTAGSFADRVGKHPAVYGEFVTGDQSIPFAFAKRT